MKIGIDIGGTHVGVGLISNEDPEEILLIKEKYIYKEDKEDEAKSIETIKEAMIEGIEYILRIKKISLNDIDTIGVGIPGKTNDYEVRDAKNLNISYFPVFDFLKEYLNAKRQEGSLEEDKAIDILIKNDNEAAALCEKQFGILKEYEDCVFLGLGTGIGSAVFLNNRLLIPKKARGFELGHMTIVVDGIPCACSKFGCFEKYCSMSSLLRRINDDLESKGIRFDNNDPEFFDKNYDLLKHEIEAFVKYLAIGLINIIDIFEPQAICFGGGFSKYKDGVIFKRLNEVLKETPRFSTNLPEIVVSKHMNDAGIIGSVLERK